MMIRIKAYDQDGKPQDIEDVVLTFDGNGDLTHMQVVFPPQASPKQVFDGVLQFVGLGPLQKPSEGGIIEEPAAFVQKEGKKHMAARTKKTTATRMQATEAKAVARDDTQYHASLDALAERFRESLPAGTDHRLFTTAPTGQALYDLYLAKIDVELRQHYTCNACKHFIRRYGGLVTIDPETGRHRSVFWHEDDAIDELKPAYKALRVLVEKAKVDGVFVSSALRYGFPKTGVWRHPAVTPPKAVVWRDTKLLTDSQKMAEFRENHKTLSIALAQDVFKVGYLRAAKTLMEANAVASPERFLPQIEWLLARQAEKRAPGGPDRLWLAVAMAPAGFCSPRSNMVGTLLDDIAAGLSTDDIRRKFNTKAAPQNYQRPKAAPTEGNIKRAEDIFAKMGLEAALRRRFATMEDIRQHLVWAPPPPTPSGAAAGGVFASIRPKADPVPQVQPPVQTMTGEKFARTVLPKAVKVEFLVPSRGQFVALTTAADPDALPLLQWDEPDNRNPFSWYVIVGGSPAHQWGLSAHTWVPVIGISDQPNTWMAPDRYTHHGNGLYLYLQGARDTIKAGSALFPALMRSDLREVSSVIEAYSNQNPIEAVEAVQLATGFRAGKGYPWSDIQLRVTDADQQVLRYQLDRWD